MAYTYEIAHYAGPTTWAAEDPITAGKMNNLEAGVVQALNQLLSAASTQYVSDAILELSTTLNSKIQNNNNAIAALQTTVDEINTNASDGHNAYQQILEAGLLFKDPESPTVPSLANALQILQTKQADLTSALATNYDFINNYFIEIRDARGDNPTKYKNISINPASLRLNDRLDDMDFQIEANRSAAQIASSNYEAAKGQHTSLVKRLDAIDGNVLREQTGTSMYTDITNLQTEISDARGTNIDGGNNSTLSQHFTQIEGRLTTDEGLITARIPYNDIVDNLESDNANKVLSARQGKALNTAITSISNVFGGNFNTANTISDAIDAAEDAAKDYSDAHKVDKNDVYNGVDYTTDDKHVLDARVGKLLADRITEATTATNLSLTTLDDRADAIEGEIAAAHRDLGIDEDTQEPIADSLDKRFDDIEASISDNSTKINTIATELSMVDGNAISGANSRIDTLEFTISHPTDENDNGGLTERLEATEAAIGSLNDDLSTLDTAYDSAFDTIENRLDAIDGSVGNTFKNRLQTVESTTASLVTDVNNLKNEPNSATVIIPAEQITYNEETGMPTLYTTAEKTTTITPSSNADYLLQNDDGKYYYWKYIDNAWNLISGGGGSGTGTSSAVIAEELPETDEADLNTDYYIGTPATGYIHYRFIVVYNEDLGENEIHSVVIGQHINTNNIKTYNMERVDTTRVNSETNEEEEVSYLNLYEFDYGADNSVIDTQSASMHLRAQIELPKGGGGATSAVTTNLIRIGNQSVQTITNSTVLLRVFFSAWDQNESYDGNYTLKAGSNTIATGVLHSGAADESVSGWKTGDGYYEFDVSSACKIGTTTFNLTVDVNGSRVGKTWSVQIIDLRLESDAPNTLMLANTNSYNFPYVPYGALDKTLHVLVDNVEIGTQLLRSASSGRAANYTIPAQAHGAHKVEMYLEATIGNSTNTTERVVREYIWYDASNTEDPIIIASQYKNQTIEASQYATIEIPYQVYKKDATNINVEYYLDEEETPFDNITLEDTTSATLSYLAAEIGEHTLTIKVDDETLVVNLVISELEDIDVSPVEGAIIDFDPTTLTNSSANRLPTWTANNTTYHLTASDNFNWSDDSSGGGYKNDVDGKCFVIKAGSYVDLDYKMFATNGSGTNAVFDTGAELKVIFKTAAVRDANAVWLSNVGTLNNKNVGIQLGAHSGWLKTDKATDTDVSIEPDENGVITINNTSYNVWKPNTEYELNAIVVVDDTIYKCTEAHTSGEEFDDGDWQANGKLDTGVLATNSYLYFPYSEGDKIELDININKFNANKRTNFLMSYEDGVPSKAYSYTAGVSGDGLRHAAGFESTIRIGSPDCDVYIYRLRIYNNSLETDQILQNFIADGRDINEKIDRYNRNCIYWDSLQKRYFTSPSGDATLDPVKLAEKMPNVKILMLDTPVFTTGKKDFVGGPTKGSSTLRCIHARGGKIYESRGDADNWFFQNGFHSGQGTTSDNYGQSARNIDFLFEVDGVHWPTKKKNIEKAPYSPSLDYRSSVLVGENATKWDEETQTWVPTSIYNSETEEWEPNADILSAEELANWQATVPDVCTDWKGDDCKVSLTETSVPNNYFNLKVNVASSENVNNALFQKRYNDFLVYKSPATAAQKAVHSYENNNQIKVKNCMEFVPAVLFVREYDPDTSKHTEFKDTNWHFYALGNIGDSKKTDYTRAYDPTDMNEFTVENSDNNTNNGQFQSGVFEYNGHRAIETRYEAYDSSKTYAENTITVNNGALQKYNGSTWEAVTLSGWTDSETPYFAPYTAPNPMSYVYPITSSEWNVMAGEEHLNYKHYTLDIEEFDGDHSFEFRYACKGDYRDGDLINVSTGQDDNAQEVLNHDTVLAFYEWLITSTEEQYAAEAPEWFVKNAMEFFYAYTHYYTMMDNRAKNTFWHFAKTGKYRKVSRPVPALLHIYEEAEGTPTLVSGETNEWTGTFTPTSDTAIDNSKTYYTQYAFDLWIYDTDTAAGIDNNGALVFPYGKEDTDYRTEGDPQSGYAFNGAGSIFWRRLRTTFADEIREVMNATDSSCFNSENLIQEFDRFQDCYPEEIWRLDIERKYIRTFTGESIDNSIDVGKQNPRFLTSMMQGRKKYQRRQWIRDQGVYFNSKYRLNDIINNTNTIEFNCTTPADTVNIAVTPDYHLQLVPYQDMYLNVQVGNGNYQPQIRAKAGQTYVYDLKNPETTPGNYQETRIYINGANHLSKIGNLAPMYPYSFDLRALAHIKELDIGTDEANYVNTKFTELVLPNNVPILEKLNIKNCHSVAGTINLSEANNLKVIDAVGTVITGINLPDYTNVETIRLPATVNAIELHGAKMLKEFSILDNLGNTNYSNLTTLKVYDSDYSVNFKENASDPLPVDWMAVATAVVNTGSAQSRITLQKLYSATIQDITILESFARFKTVLEAANSALELSGVIHVNGDWSTPEKTKYESVWAPGLTLDTENGNYQQKYQVTFKYDNDTAMAMGLSEEETIIYEYYADEVNATIGAQLTHIEDGQPYALDPLSLGWISPPERTMTEQYTYQFGELDNGEYIPFSGWTYNGSTPEMNTSFKNNIILYTHFNRQDRYYKFKWYMDEPINGVINESSKAAESGNIKYGEGATVSAPTVAELRANDIATYRINGNRYKIFKGWSHLPLNITPDNQNIFAVWEEHTVGTDFSGGINLSNLTAAELLELCETSSVLANVNQTDRMTIPLGYDGADDTGEQLITPTANANYLRISKNNYRTITGRTPLAADEAFTLVLDFKYDINTSDLNNQTVGESILASCYSNDNGSITGFKLFYDLKNKVSRISFGDTAGDTNLNNHSIVLGGDEGAHSRNIVVLRHPANSPTLYVYYGTTANGLTNTVTEGRITLPSFIACTRPIIFGACSYSNGSYIDDLNTLGITTGRGVIYYAKLWNKDLGVGECKQLANWCHESITFGVVQTRSKGDVLNIPQTDTPPRIYLSSLSTSAMTGYKQDSPTSEIAGWINSSYRTMLNKRLFDALPIQLQSIAYPTVIVSRHAELQTSSFTTTYAINTGVNDVIQGDYISIPSYREITGNSGELYRTEANGKLPWGSATNVTVLEYDGTSSFTAGATSERYMTARFKGVPISYSPTVYKINSSLGINIYSTITRDHTLQAGDIWESGDTLYIYADRAQVIAGAPVVQASSGSIYQCSEGGWVPATAWWTRTFTNEVYGNTNFMYVQANGQLQESTVYAQTCSVDYSIGF